MFTLLRYFLIIVLALFWYLTTSMAYASEGEKEGIQTVHHTEHPPHDHQDHDHLKYIRTREERRKKKSQY